MKFTIDTWQRVMLVTIVGQLQGPVSLIRNASKLLDILELSDEEGERVGLARTPSGATWSNRNLRWDLQVNDKEQLRLLRQSVGQFQSWPAANSGQVLELFDALEIEEE